jgi:hypothetical protein
MGASTVREGLDTSVIERMLTETKVVNLASTGGHSAIDAIEVQAVTLSSLADRYACIVVGLHPIFLKNFDRQSYSLVTTDYVAVLPLVGLFDLSNGPWTFPDISQLVYKYFAPLGQQSLILQRLIRLSLFRAHRLLINPDALSREFEEIDGEFVPQPQFYYAGRPPVLKDIEETYPAEIRQIGWDLASSYGGKHEAAALHHALHALSQLTDQLIVLELPESHLFRNVETVARTPYEVALSAANDGMTRIQCKLPSKDELDVFHDAIHLNSRGRGLVSESLGRLLQASHSLDLRSQPDDVCRISEVKAAPHVGKSS